MLHERFHEVPEHCFRCAQTKESENVVIVIVLYKYSYIYLYNVLVYLPVQCMVISASEETALGMKNKKHVIQNLPV